MQPALGTLVHVVTDMEVDVEVSVLGSVGIRRSGTEVELGMRLRRLLAGLVVSNGSVVSTDRLVEVVWAGDPPDGAEKTLSSYVTRLRRALDSDGPRIVFREPGYVIDLSGAEFDSAMFDEDLDRGLRHLRTADTASASTVLEGAIARWRGEAYAGFAGEDWARPEAVRLQERLVEAREALIESRLACGRNDEAVADAQALVEEEPLRERPRVLLMRAMYAHGRQAEALRVFSSYRRYLADETGLDPSDEIVSLERRIARGDPSLTGTARPLRGYELGERIGEGAFAVVHRAVQPGIERDVAIKIIRAELADRAEFVRRFEFEAKTVARIEHPNVVPLFDYWREPGAAYLVMRLLPGGSVDQALRARGPYSREQTVRLLDDIGGALETAHRAGVVHRDVRPANLLLDAEGTTYLADFGIALPTSTLDDQPIASPAYAAPEVLRGEPTGPAADVLSLGITTFEMLTGRLPFADSIDRGDLIRRQLSEPLPPVRATRTDLPAAVDDVLARATAKAPADRYQTVGAFVDDLRSALEVEATSLRPIPIEWSGPVHNPYLGLHAFDEGDADRFFGRERLVTELVDAVEAHPMVVVVGPSGSGKSSVVRAGVLPALRRGAVPGSESWFVATMMPGTDPVDALETALLRVAVNPPATLREQLAEPGGLLRAIRRILPDEKSRLLLIVDQLEELFTQARDPDERDRFLVELADAITHPDSPLRVMATLRADHYDAPLRHTSIADLATDGTVTVRPMANDELQRAISQPAASVGVEVESALVTELVAGIGTRPAALPLLQFSLTELFDRRAANTMLLSAHHELGGLTGALAARADRILDEGGPDDEREMRRIFGRLVTPGDATDDVRRRALRSEFGAGERTAWLIDAFVTARLLTTDRDPTTREPTIEVAHEALLRDWPRAAAWLREDRELRRTTATIGAAADAWERSGRETSDLYRGRRLESAIEAADEHPDWLRPIDHEFLTAGAEQTSRELASQREQVERQRRDNRRLRRRLVALAIAVVMAIGAGLVAVSQRNSARDAAAVADANARENRVSELAAASAGQLATDPELSTLLALAASEAATSEDSRDLANQALHGAVLETRVLGRLPGGAQGVASFHPDGDSFLTGYGGEAVAIWGGRPIEQLRVLRHGCRIQDGEFSPDGTFVATTCDDGAVRIWRTQTGGLAHRLPTGPTAVSLVPAWSNDGTMVAASVLPDLDSRVAFQPGEVHVWDAESGDLLQVITAPPGAAEALNLEFSPDDQLLATTFFVADNDDAALWVWNVGTWELAREYVGHGAAVTDVGFTPDGGRLVTVSVDATARVWDVATGTQLGVFGGHLEALRDVEISPDGSSVVSSGLDTRMWNLDTFAEADLTIHHRDADGLDFSPDGSQLITSSHVDGFTMLWDIAPEGAYELIGFPASPAELSSRIDIIESPPGGIAFDPRGDALATRGVDSDASVFDLRSGVELAALNGPGSPLSSLAYSDDGGLIAAGGPNGARVWSTETWEETAVMRPGERVHEVAFRPGSRDLTVIGEFGIETWTTGGRVTTLSRTESMAGSYTHTGSLLLTHEVYAGLTFHDVTTATPIGVIGVSDGSGKVDAISFSADDSLVAVAGQEVAIWRTGPPPERLLVLEGHGNAVRDVAFTHDDSAVVSLAGDGVVRIWDVETGTVRLTLESPGATDLDLSRDGRLLATISTQGTATVFLLDPSELVVEARRRLTRTWTEVECVQYRIDPCPNGDQATDESS